MINFMVLFPKKVKFRKSHRFRENPKDKKIATRGNKLSFGSHGLKAEDPGLIKVNQIEAARKTMSRFVQKTGKIWIRIFPCRPITAKPPEVGMGNGKGDPVGYVAAVRPGTVIFEMDGVTEGVAKEALRKAGSKLPIRTKIISRN